MHAGFVRAEELGIRLEIVRGLPIWEAAPAYRHQKEVDRIRASIHRRPGAQCACVHASDVYVQFPDGSINSFRIIDPRQFILSATFDL